VRVFEKGEFLGTVSKIDCSKQSQINPIQLWHMSLNILRKIY
jgi:hypothetical protein